MRVRDGRIVEHWGVANLYKLLEQLGALPAAASTTQPAGAPD